jgi:hypothetical protein
VTDAPLVLDEQLHSGWCRVELYGAKAAARAHIKQGRAQLGQMRSQYGINDSAAEGATGFWHMNQKLADGTTIQTIHNAGHDTIRIVAPPTPAPQKKPGKRKQRIVALFARVVGNLFLPDQYPPGPDAERPAHWRVGSAPSPANLQPNAPDVISGITNYGYLYAKAISGDGRLIGGGGFHQDEDFGWTFNTATGEFVQINANGLGISQIEVTGFSRDSRVVVGTSFTGGAWRMAGGVVTPIGSVVNTSLPVVVSGNGRYVAWTSGGGSTTRTSSLWHVEQGLIANNIPGVALAVSDDGMVVGNDGGSQSGYLFNGGSAVTWTFAGGSVILGSGTASSISHDGTHIGGYTTASPYLTPWLWTEADGVSTIDAGAFGFAYVTGLAKPYFLPDTTEEALRLIDAQQVWLSGVRYSGNSVEIQYTADQEPWETNNLPEYQDGTTTVITMVPTTNLAEQIEYDESQWPDDGPLIPLIAVSTGLVYGTVERAAFQQQSYQDANHFYVETIPGGDPTVVVTAYWTPCYWDRELVLHDLDMASSSIGSTWGIALPVAEVEITHPLPPM